MRTPYRAGAPGAVRAWPENPDELNLIASLKTGTRLHGGSAGWFVGLFLPEDGWEHYFSLPCLALGTVQTRAFTRCVTAPCRKTLVYDDNHPPCPLPQ